jgi:hypothetical protein
MVIVRLVEFFKTVDSTIATSYSYLLVPDLSRPTEVRSFHKICIAK